MRIEQGVRIESIGNAANYISREFYSYLKTKEMKRTRAHILCRAYYDQCNKRNQNNNKKQQQKSKKCDAAKTMCHTLSATFSYAQVDYLFRIHHRFVSLQFCFDECR